MTVQIRVGVSSGEATAALITAALAETAQLDMPAEAAKLQRLREKVGPLV